MAAELSGATVHLSGARVSGCWQIVSGRVRHDDYQHRWSLDGLTYAGVPLLDGHRDRNAWITLLRTATPRYAAQPYQQLGCCIPDRRTRRRCSRDPDRAAARPAPPRRTNDSRPFVGPADRRPPRLRLPALACPALPRRCPSSLGGPVHRPGCPRRPRQVQSSGRAPWSKRSAMGSTWARHSCHAQRAADAKPRPPRRERSRSGRRQEACSRGQTSPAARRRARRGVDGHHQRAARRGLHPGASHLPGFLHTFFTSFEAETVAVCHGDQLGAPGCGRVRTPARCIGCSCRPGRAPRSW